MTMPNDELPAERPSDQAVARPAEVQAELPMVRALSDRAFHRFQRAVWAVCVVVYLAVFLGGIQAGGSELWAVARAAGFTLVAALLGRTALGLLGRASSPGEPVPMAGAEGKVGSLASLLGSTNVPTQADHADEEDSAKAA
jgi:hypothetical protein